MPKHSTIGIDLGGTKIDITRFNAADWSVEDNKRMDTHADQAFDHVFGDIVELAKELQTPETTGVGIGVPGLVQQPTGVIQTLPNIPGAQDFPLQERLSEALSLPVSVDNDANCFALAEAKCGAGKGKNVVVGVTMGTGVGGGIVIDGKVFHGSQGFAAEIGHMLLMPGQPPVKTENMRGDVEQFFSGTALGRRCQQASSPDEYLEGETCSFMHQDLYKEISWMCTNLIHLLDPAIIIFGGSAGNAFRSHLPKVEEELHNWLLPDTPIPELVISDLENASTLGAALLS